VVQLIDHSQDIVFPQEALTAFNHAIQLNPHLAIAHHNKGLALEHLGHPKAAQQAYERAKQLGYSG
jgi:Flp pilus assembly protein TadD